MTKHKPSFEFVCKWFRKKEQDAREHGIDNAELWFDGLNQLKSLYAINHELLMTLKAVWNGIDFPKNNRRDLGKMVQQAIAHAEES